MKRHIHSTTLLAAIIALGLQTPAARAQEHGETPQASAATRTANTHVAERLPLADRGDFDAAERGLIARDPALVIKDSDGQPIWDITAYDFIEGDAPATVNPSLWRQAKLNDLHGLYKVTDRVYQLRGYDLSNMSLIEGDSGWIVVDPLTTAEAKAETVEQRASTETQPNVFY